MDLSKLTSKNSNRAKKRVGRGIAGKGGKSAGRGTKGQKARTGYNIPNRFEGGQSPLILRSPKLRGFKSKKIKPELISFKILEKHFPDGAKITIKELKNKHLINKRARQVKILDGRNASKKYRIYGCHFSKSVAKMTKIKTKSND